MTILDRIAASRRIEIEQLKVEQPLESFIDRLDAMPRTTFASRLADGDDVKIIAELKRRSPSKGLLREDFNPIDIATAYRDGGAAALSVLTEPSFFEGSYDNLKAAKKAAGLPVLCKDFVVDRYQLFHARHIGADAVLLIVALLTSNELARHLRLAEQIGIDCLVEVHDEEDLKVALEAGANIVGVNNRNLNDFSVSLRTAEMLAVDIPDTVLKVAESGIGHAGDINRLRRSGYNCFLIGETLVKAADPAEMIRELRGV